MNAITLRRTVIGFARISFLFLFAALAGVSKAPAQVVGVSITVAPPALPVYDQPPIPGPGYIWTPGYWAWDDGDYYWVPGTWCEPPAVGLLWTPGYWGWNDGIYAWNAGYWGPTVGFYGGVSYGFGYVGVGYEGGFWRGGVFSYNRTVNNFGNVNITNVYNKTVVVNNVTNVSYNGGAGGLTARPNQRELAAATERHVAATRVQTQHQQLASTNRDLRASVNSGKPAVAATTNAGRFQGAGVVAARHDGGATGGTGHSSAAGAHSPTGALNAAPGNTGVNKPQPNNASLNHAHSGSGTGQRLPSATSLQPGVQGIRPNTQNTRPNTQSTRPSTPIVGGGRPGGSPGGFRPPSGGNPPRIANVARPAVAAPVRGPAPRGPAPRGPQQHH
jgi:hypothetical protein